MKKPGSLLAPIAAVVMVAASLAWPALAQEPTSPPAQEPKKDEAQPPAPTPEAAPSAPSTPSESQSLSFHGEARYRYEFWRNATDFTNTTGTGAGDDTFDVAPWRIRLSAMGDLGHGITTLADLQGTGVWGSLQGDNTRDFFGDDTNPGTDVDLYQGWVNVSDFCSSSLDLKVGRQEIDFDRGLHFSSEPYYNGRSHDGVMATWDAENRAIHTFWTRAVESDSFGSPVHDDDDLLGAHVRYALGEDKASDFAYYAFYKIGRGDPATGHSSIYTVGARHGRERKTGSGWIWNLEGAYQGGETALSPSQTLDRSASVYEGMIGYASDKSGSARSYWVGLYKASGDGDPSDNVMNSFEPLYPELHDRLGDSDLFPLTNVRAIHAGFKTAFRENHTFRAEFFQFAKVKEKDVIVSPLSGVTLSSSCTTTATVRCSDDLGREFDFAYGYQVGEGVTLGITLAYVAPGNTIEDELGVPSITNSGQHGAYRLAFGARARF